MAGSATPRSVGSALWFLTVQATGTAPTMAGDAAEQWTAQELRRLRRQGWMLVHRLVLREHEDIDHVLIGPGGCYAIETKWTATAWQLNPPEDRVSQAATQASRNAKRLRLWQPLKSIGIAAHPVVFCGEPG